MYLTERVSKIASGPGIPKTSTDTGRIHLRGQVRFLNQIHFINLPSSPKTSPNRVEAAVAGRKYAALGARAPGTCSPLHISASLAVRSSNTL